MKKQRIRKNECCINSYGRKSLMLISRLLEVSAEPERNPEPLLYVIRNTKRIKEGQKTG